MAKMFRKTGLPHVTPRDPSTRQWALRLSKTLDDLTTEQAKQYTSYIDNQITTVNTSITNVLNTYGALLSGEDGSIWYAWNGTLAELKHGSYGQVLVTGGHGQRPFWDWVWQAPGADAAVAFTLYLIVEAEGSAEMIVPDYERSGTGPIETYISSNLGVAVLSTFQSQDTSVSTSDSASKVTLDYTETTDLLAAYGEGTYGEYRYGGAAGLLTEIITSVA